MHGTFGKKCGLDYMCMMCENAGVGVDRWGKGSTQYARKFPVL